MQGVAAVLADAACTAAVAVGVAAGASFGAPKQPHTSAAAVAVGAAFVAGLQQPLLRMLRQLSAALQVKLAACPNPCLAAHAGPRDPMAAWSLTGVCGHRLPPMYYYY